MVDGEQQRGLFPPIKFFGAEWGNGDLRILHTDILGDVLVAWIALKVLHLEL